MSENKAIYRTKQTEHQLQEACVQWFRWNYPQYHYDFFAIENGGSRNILEAVNLKKRGVTSGVADCLLHVGKIKNEPEYFTYSVVHGLYIEFKIGKNKQTESQKKFEIAQKKHNKEYAIIRTLDEFIKVVTEYLAD